MATTYLQLFDFLGPGEVDHMVAYVEQNLDHLDQSTIYNEEAPEGVLDANTRRSRVAMDTSELRPIFEDRLMALLPHVRRELGMPRFDFGQLETQLTVHGEGDFFTSHRDENHPGTDGARALTFVYYFNAEPCEFEGGLLRLRDDAAADPETGTGSPADTVGSPAIGFVDIAPVSNSIVFFPAHLDHEVMPVRTTGSGVGSFRCTFNGWFRIGKGTGKPVPQLSRHTQCELQQEIVPRVTDRGFSIRPTPPSVHRRLALFWAHHRALGESEPVSTDYFPSGAPDFVPIGPLGFEILEELRPLHQAWAGVDLVPVAAYGVRNFRSGQVLAMHVDRCESHIVTSELQIDQALEAPWPLRIRLGDDEHDAYLEAGHMVTYEGASCPNGRPTPMQGSTYASLLLHYQPVDWHLTPAQLIERGAAIRLIDGRGQLLDRAHRLGAST